MALVHITAKLAGMRKAQDFVVYPRKVGEPIIVQSDRAIGKFDPQTGEGVLNWKGSNPKYAPHLYALGVEPYTFPRDFVLLCQEMTPNSGDHIGPGVYVA